MKIITSVFVILFLQTNLFAQWKSELKKDKFNNSTKEYYAFCKSEIKQYNKLIFTILTIYDTPEDSTQTQEPFTFVMYRPSYQDYFISNLSENSYLTDVSHFAIIYNLINYYIEFTTII